MRAKLAFLSFLACTAVESQAAPAGALTIGDLRCEYAANPVGIDTTQPRLSWKLNSNLRGQRQTAFQILVASTEEKLAAGDGDLWDTDKIESGQSIQVEYNGRPLASRQRCYWKVRAWDKDGKASPYSAAAFWEMGLLSDQDWIAEWIGYPAGWPGRALYFRNEITCSKPVRKARAHIAGLGYYELRVNGTRAGDHVLDPGWTDYSKRVLYATYDVGSLLRIGTNVIGVIVGNGWYGMPKLLMQLEVTYTDGSVVKFATTAAIEAQRGG